jgi:amidase
MRAAGAIFAGKTNVPEWGQGSHSFNPVFGVTRNPYDLTRSAGGSSGGAAAALASADGLGRGRVGHDGVIAQPGGFCNVYGLRPTWGLVPSDAEGDTFLSTLATEGPMARTIEDVARLLLVQAGENPEVPFPRAVPDVLSGLDRGVKGLRIGWLGDWGGAYPMEPGILDACARRACACWRVWGRWSNRWPRPSRPKSCGQSWVTLRAMLNAGGKRALAEDPAKRALTKPETLVGDRAGSGPYCRSGRFEASVIRSRWYKHAARLFRPL